MSLYVIRMKDGRNIEADDVIIDQKKEWIQYIVPYQHNRAMLRMDEITSISEKTSGIGEPVQFHASQMPQGWKRPFPKKGKTG